MNERFDHVLLSKLAKNQPFGKKCTQGSLGVKVVTFLNPSICSAAPSPEIKSEIEGYSLQRVLIIT